MGRYTRSQYLDINLLKEYTRLTKVSKKFCHSMMEIFLFFHLKFANCQVRFLFKMVTSELAPTQNPKWTESIISSDP